MKITKFVAAAVLAFASVSAEAQSSGSLKFQPTAPTPAVTAFGYYVGPFWGTITSDPTQPKIDLFCVDVLNSITWGQTWNANFSSLGGDLSLTRHGNAKRTSYEQAAYLASMYKAPGVATAQWGGIQAAIWNLLNPGAPNGGTNVNSNGSEAYWLAQASAWHGSAAKATFDFSRWTVVTDVRGAGRVSGAGAQEFLTTGVAPEPETWLLMGTGLFLVVGFAVKRGRLA